MGAVIQDSRAKVEVEVLAGPADVNGMYEEALAHLRIVKSQAPEEKAAAAIAAKGTLSIAEKDKAAKDYYANVRTNVLLIWVLSNVSVHSPMHTFATLTVL